MALLIVRQFEKKDKISDIPRKHSTSRMPAGRKCAAPGHLSSRPTLVSLQMVDTSLAMSERLGIDAVSE